MIDILILIFVAVIFFIHLIKTIRIVLKIEKFQNNREKYIKTQGEFIDITYKSFSYFPWKATYRFFDNNGIEKRYLFSTSGMRKEDAEKSITIYYNMNDSSDAYDEMIIREKNQYIRISIVTVIAIVIDLIWLFYKI